MVRYLAVAVISSCLVTLTACPPTRTQVGKNPSWRAKQHKGVEPPRAPAKPQTVFLAPRSPAVQFYNGGARPPASAHPLHATVLQAVLGAVPEDGRRPPVHDARLSTAATELATVANQYRPMPYALIEFAMQHYGIIEPSPHIVVLAAQAAERDYLAQQVAQNAAALMGTKPFARVGVGIATTEDKRDYIVLAFQESYVTTKAIPRRLGTSSKFLLEAELSADFHDPKLIVTRPDGLVIEPEVSLGSGNLFSAIIHCSNAPGRQQIEIAASDATGSTVLANFPQWCGSAPPTSLRYTLKREPTLSNVSEAERYLFQLVNEERARYRLPALTYRDDLADVARKHSVEMRDTGVVAHISPRTGSARDRVSRAGIKAAAVLENVARATTLVEAHEGLMNSPGHRANILARHATDIGVGIVQVETPEQTYVLVSQVFTYHPPRIDRSDAVARLHKKIARHGRLSKHELLERHAQEIAQEVASGRAKSKAQATIRQAEQGRHFRETETVVATVASIENLDIAAITARAKYRRYGVGIAQGVHEDLGKGAIFVVLLLAD